MKTGIGALQKEEKSPFGGICTQETVSLISSASYGECNALSWKQFFFSGKKLLEAILLKWRNLLQINTKVK
jgi:hypothetical protein